MCTAASGTHGCSISVVKPDDEEEDDGDVEEDGDEEDGALSLCLGRGDGMRDFFF